MIFFENPPPPTWGMRKYAGVFLLFFTVNIYTFLWGGQKSCIFDNMKDPRPGVGICEEGCIPPMGVFFARGDSGGAEMIFF